MKEVPLGAIFCNCPTLQQPNNQNYSAAMQLDPDWENIHEGTKTWWKWTEDRDA